ncbi:hypothetical protein NEPAR04_2527 [Nematocida parisii]|nr:hypothetical protein NEPAR04_2527 [Nematocida parisii]
MNITQNLTTTLRVIGPAILPFLFGMCLTSLNTLCNIRVPINIYSGADQLHDGIQISANAIEGVRLEDSKYWTLVPPALFAGAFTLSAAIFIAGMYKKTPHPYFKTLFTTAAAFICTGNILFIFTRNNLLLSVYMYFIGIGTGIACALGPVYYTDLLGPVTGSKVASLQGLFINLGVLLEGTLSGHFKEPIYIFWVIAAISFISFIINIIFTKSSNSESNSRAVEAAGYTNIKTRKYNPKMLIVSCLIMQAVQQMTGINPILSSRNMFFTETNTVSEYFFNTAGVIGTALSSLVMFFAAGFKEAVFLSGIACALSLGILAFSKVSWSAGVYFLFFSLGLANLPWILPGMLLQEESDITMAAGLGSLANSAVSCIALVIYTRAQSSYNESNLSVNWIFLIFSAFSLIEGIFGYFLVRASERQRKQSKITESVEMKELATA